MAILSIVSQLSVQTIFLQICVVLLSVIIYRRYMLPASDIPGPFLASFTRLWHAYHLLVGDFNLRLLELHKKHGESVDHCSIHSKYIILTQSQGALFELPTMRSVSVTQTLSRRFFCLRLTRHAISQVCHMGALILILTSRPGIGLLQFQISVSRTHSRL